MVHCLGKVHLTKRTDVKEHLTDEQITGFWTPARRVPRHDFSDVFPLPMVPSGLKALDASVFSLRVSARTP